MNAYAVLLNGRQYGIVGDEGRENMIENGSKCTFVLLQDDRLTPKE